MADIPSIRGPRFNVGDGVEVVGPGNVQRGKRGIVIEIIEPASNRVYRYRVRFADETSAIFFGFDLQLTDMG